MKGRTKGKIGEKHLKDESPKVQDYLTTFGELYMNNRDACRVAERWNEILVMMNGEIREITTDVEATMKATDRDWIIGKPSRKIELSRQIGLMIGLIERAIVSGDGAFFRDFADALERARRAIDSQRKFALWFGRRRSRKLSARELAAVVDTSEREARKWAKHLNIPLREEKRGRPRGAKAVLRSPEEY